MRIATPESRALETAGALALALTLAACRPPLPERPDRPADAGSGEDGDAGGAPVIQVEPAVDGGAPPVARFRIPAQGDAGAAPMLFEGELDAYYVGRIKRGAIPTTLLQRQVPALSWSEPGWTVLAPNVPLAAGETYSIASESDGLVAAVTVVDDGTPYLARVWPPPEGGGQTAVYCGEDGDAPRALASVTLDPGAIPGFVTPGVVSTGLGEGRCVTLHVADPGPAPLVPPLRVGGVALDPAALAVAPAEVAPPVACEPGEIAFGPGCASVEDDRVTVRSPGDPRLWCVAGAGAGVIESVGASGTLVIDGLAPASTVHLDVAVLDVAGHVERASGEVTTALARPHLVLSEVLANPLGAEPQEEWIEIVNDGGAAVDTGGWVIADSAGETQLPSLALAPGGYALVVRDDFVPDDGVDVAVPAGVPLLSVQQLGKNGLSNSGEMLELRAPDGSVVSRFPALKAATGGVSTARRDPSSPDDDPSAFGPHAGPGASPGAPNTLE